MSIQPGTKLGSFEVMALLGAGGMGEVYRARDTKLGRDVAIKVLAHSLATNPEYLKRFEREARLLAALDHANIAAIFDFCHHGQTHFLVMQLVEGETLEERLSHGPIPLQEAIPLFCQIARGLDAAHEKGIVHRDLKPANVKICGDGVVKVIDFGIARAEPDAEALDHNAPTTPLGSSFLTQAGAIAGTPQYMSPEQARGKPVDRRTDVWAFGCCLYEALGGARPFDGETMADVVGQIVHLEPDWNGLERHPPVVGAVLRRLLSKDRRRRYSSLNDVACLLEDFAQWTPSKGTDGDSVSHRVQRFSLNLPANLPLARPGYADYNLAISADASTVVYVAERDGANILVVRRLDERQWVVLEGTQDACQPCLSPDGNAVAYLHRPDRTVRRIDSRGGRPATLGRAAIPCGPYWADDGYIYYSVKDGTARVPARGGPAEAVLGLSEESDEKYHANQFVVLDAAKLVYVDDGLTTEECTVLTAALGGRTRVPVIDGAIRPHYVRTGHIVCSQVGRLVAVPVEPGTLKPAGEIVDVSEPDLAVPARAPMHFGISKDGTFVYAPEAVDSEAESRRTLVIVSESGEETPLELEPNAYQMPRVSPDGNRIAVTVTLEGDRSIWIHDRSVGTFTRLTFGARDDQNPVWSPDGGSIVFTSNREANSHALYLIPSDGSDEPARFGPDFPNPRALGWTPDGGMLLFVARTDARKMRSAFFDCQTKKSTVFDMLAGEQHSCALSPDGRWIAYESVESGRREIVVQSFPELKGKWQISRSGGGDPAWSPNGDALYYIRGQTLVKVETKIGSSFSPGRQIDLFSGPYVSDPVLHRRMYDVMPDGSGFLMIRESARTVNRTELHVILNWFEEIRRLAPH